jgi:hypothetical protein
MTLHFKPLSTLLLCLVIISASSCSQERTDPAIVQFRKYVGTWRNLASGSTMKIRNEGDTLVVHDDHGGVLGATIDSNGDIETSLGKMSIEPQSGHLVCINGEYDRVAE